MGATYSLTRYFFITAVRTRTFFAIISLVIFTIILMGIMSYQTLSVTGYDSLGYVLNRVSGFEKLNLVYFLWSMPYQILAVLVSIIISSGMFANDYENGESSIYYSYPVSWSHIFMSKVSASFLASLLPVAVFAVAENLIVGIYFITLPPLTMFYSIAFTMLSILAIISLTALISVVLRNSLMSALVALILYYVIMNIVNIYFIIMGSQIPSFLLSNEVDAISQVFSMINLIPFGSSGSVGPAGNLLIVRDIAYLALYSSFSLSAAILVLNGRDAA